MYEVHPLDMSQRKTVSPMGAHGSRHKIVLAMGLVRRAEGRAEGREERAGTGARRGAGKRAAEWDREPGTRIIDKRVSF